MLPLLPPLLCFLLFCVFFLFFIYCMSRSGFANADLFLCLFCFVVFSVRQTNHERAACGERRRQARQRWSLIHPLPFQPTGDSVPVSLLGATYVCARLCMLLFAVVSYGVCVLFASCARVFAFSPYFFVCLFVSSPLVFLLSISSCRFPRS